MVSTQPQQPDKGKLFQTRSLLPAGHQRLSLATDLVLKLFLRIFVSLCPPYKKISLKVVVLGYISQKRLLLANCREICKSFRPPAWSCMGCKNVCLFWKVKFGSMSPRYCVITLPWLTDHCRVRKSRFRHLTLTSKYLRVYLFKADPAVLTLSPLWLPFVFVLRW